MRTKNQQYFEDLEHFINSYKDQFGKPPSSYDIALGTGMSQSNVARYLKHMRESGMIEYNGACSYKTQRDKKTSRRIHGVPVVGDIACGLPLLAEENIEEYVDLPESWVGKGRFFALHAKGESMRNIGINDGDIVIVRQQDTAEPGQVVVALVDENTATLKRYFPQLENQIIELRPENDEFESQFIDLTERPFAIQGIVVKVLKNIP